jgi:autotransporter-associated beta strand protein
MRPFAAPMSVGELFSVRFDSPATYNTPNPNYYPFVIINFANAAGQKTFEIKAGKNKSYGEFPWAYDDATGNNIDTGVDPDATSDGSALTFELTSATTGILKFDVGGPDLRTIPIQLKNGAPARVSFVSSSTSSSSSTSGEYEFFFNDLSIRFANEWQKAAGNNSGNWGDTPRWKAGTVPDAADALANFSNHSSIDGNPTVNVDAPRQVGTINFENDSYGYTLAFTNASNAITLNVTTGEARINVNSGSHSITAPVTMADDTTVTVTPANSTLTMTNVSASAARLTKAGAGTLVLPGTLSYSGGTTVQNGTLKVAKLHANNAVTITGGTLQVMDSSPTFPSHPSGNDAQVSQPKQLTISGTGKLDLGNNDMILAYGASTPYAGVSPAAAIEDLIAQGFDGGDWLGNGITSSAAASLDASGNFALAIVDNATLPQPYGVSNGGENFDGIDVPLESVLVKFTHRVDLNLDGLVTDADAIIFSTNYEVGASATWGIGDLNYDGVFTDSDAIIFSTFYDTGVQHLPEPGTVAFFSAAAFCLRRPSNNRTSRTPCAT